MDMNADGVLDTTAWAGSQDGVLVHDTFGDGSVRSTSQFAFARHGGETDLQGLAESFDSNRDGVLNKLDMAYDKFAVWQDANQNGQADAGEVKHLIALDITEIQLHTDGVVSTPAAGVTVAGHSTATLSTGTSMLVADAAFEYTLGTKAMDPGSSSGVTSDVIPASEPGSMDPTVIQLDTATWQNKPYTFSPEELAQLNLPTSTDKGEITKIHLNLGDVMQFPVDATTGAQTESLNGTLNLSTLLGADAASQWAASATVIPDCTTTLSYSVDPMLQLMVDNHLQTVTMC
jgi:hypothetical protein